MKKATALLLVLIAVLGAALVTMRSEVDFAPTEPIASVGTREAEFASSDPSETVDLIAADESAGALRRLASTAGDRVNVAASDDADVHVLKGRVVDETGASVANFRLHAEVKRKGVGNDWEPVELGPFQGGEFLVEGMPEGRWRVVPAADGYKQGKRKSLRLPNKKGPVELALQRLATVEGVVLNPSGKPQSGVKVKILNEGAFSEPVTDQDGRFELGVYPGDLEAVALDELHAASEVMRGVATFGVPLDIELRLRVGGRIEGEVQDREGQPLIAYSITLHHSTWGLDDRRSQSSDDGLFVFPHVAAGTYWVEALKGESSGSDGSNPIRAAVEVVDGETIQVLMGGVNPNAVMLRGTVYRSGEVLPNEPIRGRMQGAQAFNSESGTRANERGEYELELPGSGRALVMVSTGGTDVIPLPVELTDESEQVFDVHVPVGRISGTVQGVASGEFKRTTVTCQAEGRSLIEGIYLYRNVRCDKQGEFAFEGLPKGSYRVALANVSDPGAVLEAIELEADGEVRGLQLQTAKRSAAEVLVIDADGKPVTGATAYAQDSAGHLYRPGMSGKTDVNGVTRFTSVTSGVYRFFAQKGDSASALSAPLRVDSEFTPRATVTLAQGANAVIRVLDGKRPVPARLWIWDSSGNEFSRTINAFDHARYLKEGDPSASYSLGPLRPGKYRVRAKSYDGRSAEGELVLDVKAPAELTLQLNS